MASSPNLTLLIDANNKLVPLSKRQSRQNAKELDELQNVINNDEKLQSELLIPAR